jgi:hypothetical protein
MHKVAEQLKGIADDIRADLKQAREDDDNDRRCFLAGELQGVLQAYDIVDRWLT